MQKIRLSLKNPFKTGLSCLLALALTLAALVAWKTCKSLRPFPEDITPAASPFSKAEFLDRNGIALSVTYTSPWNIHDWVPLHEIPPLLQDAFIEAEDRHFYDHHGVDWPARLHAVIQNISAGKAVRGASTLTEQVVRILHPRPRTLWSRWIEGIEAGQLEKRCSKFEILEFYFNQVPYARQRRGVLQAARLYFDRDLDTLNVREILALTVLVRAPSRMDLKKDTSSSEKAIHGLAERMHRQGKLSDAQYEDTLNSKWSLAESRLPVDAGHFVQYASHLLDPNTQARERRTMENSGPPKPGCRPDTPKRQGKSRITTTLDSSLQSKIQGILDHRLKDLREKEVADGAVLVVDNETQEVLAWVNGGGLSTDVPAGWIDAIVTPRQPGSTLKPFLYAMALDMGWTPATLIEDSPLFQAVGSGLHPFRNYSRKYYGSLRLREALGNSLNIPAIRTIQFTGTDRFLERLHELGFQSLSQPATRYGEGLALGNGEVSLLELVRAYTVLARKGEFRPLRVTFENTSVETLTRQVFSSEATSLIADILSDPQARRLEFGSGNILRFPVQTAVKTGTSNDHRDAWAIGFSRHHTVGIWMGNLDRSPTNGLTGTTGPGLVLRAVFAELNRYREPERLYLSPRLIPVNICRVSGLPAGPHCPGMQEWFQEGSLPKRLCPLHNGGQNKNGSEETLLTNDEPDIPRLLQPTPGLQLAMDPRIPDGLEFFSMMIQKDKNIEKVEWIVDGKVTGVTGTDKHRFLWPLSRGDHIVRARVWKRPAKELKETSAVKFTVK